MPGDVFDLLHGIFKKTRRLADEALRADGLSHTEMRLLNIIHFGAADGCFQDELLANIEIDRSNVGRSLKKLGKLGYVRREKSGRDHRAFCVFLTPKGRRIKGRLRALRENIKKTFTAGIGAQEMKTAISVLEKAERNLCGETLGEVKNRRRNIK